MDATKSLKEAWEQSGDKTITKKLSICMEELKKWSKNRFKDPKQRIEGLKQSINNLNEYLHLLWQL